MFSRTGLAVGLSIGVPFLLVGIIAYTSYYRGGRRLQRELDEEDEIDKRDLDLEEFSFNQYSLDKPLAESHVIAKSHSSTSDSDGNNKVDKSSSDETHSDIEMKNTVTQKTNYINYYDSVIPILPPPGISYHNGSSPSASSLSSMSYQYQNTSPNTPDIDHSPTQQQESPGFMKRISKSIRKASNNIAQDLSTSSPARPQYHYHHSDNSIGSGININTNSDYIKLLNRNDSSSFPSTTHTLANASNHAINLYNNFNSSNSNTGSKSNLYTNSKLSSSQVIDKPTVVTSNSDLELFHDPESVLESPFDQPTRKQRGSQYGDLNIGDDEVEDDGIVDDNGYTNYESNRQFFLNSLRP